MKLYHYVTKGNNVLEVGLLSFCQNPKADLNYYIKRSGAKTHQGICAWMDKCFEGRSRSIRLWTTPLRWTVKSLQIKDLVDSCDLFEVDVFALAKDGFVEDVYVKPSLFDQRYFSPADFEKFHTAGADEPLFKLNGVQDIDYTYQQTWDRCDDSKGLRMGPLQYYLLVIKGGIILPKYLKRILLLK